MSSYSIYFESIIFVLIILLLIFIPTYLIYGYIKYKKDFYGRLEKKFNEILEHLKERN